MQEVCRRGDNEDLCATASGVPGPPRPHLHLQQSSITLKARAESGNQRSLSVLNECIVPSRNRLAFTKLNVPFFFLQFSHADFSLLIRLCLFSYFHLGGHIRTRVM